jgi:DNA-binding Lrp family transcriptional regulator
MQKKDNDGVRQWQKAKLQETEIQITKVLFDGQPHQYSEILEKTKLGKATLSKHFKKMEKEGKITKKIDIESGKYPYPVYYQYQVDPQEKEKIKILITKENVKVSLDSIENLEIWDFLSAFILEYQLLLKEKQVKGEQINLLEIINSARKRMFELYEAHREIQDIINEK